MRPTRRSWLALALGGALFALPGCLAPTLPIPPPASPDVSAPDADGIVTVKGGTNSARANAEITVWNASLPGVKGFSDAAAPDGSWQVKLPGESKQKLLIWQRVGSEIGESIEISIP